MSQLLTLGGAAVEVKARPAYVPGTNLPSVGTEIEVVFTWNAEKRQWNYIEDLPDGESIFLWDKAIERTPLTDNEKWLSKVLRIIKDVPQNGDDSRYHRVIVLMPIQQIVNKKEKKRLAKLGNTQATQRIEHKPEQSAPKKVNRVIPAVTFNWNEVSKTWSRNFPREDGVTEMFYLVDAPQQLRKTRYKHLGMTTSSVPIDVEVTRKLDSESDKILKFEVRAIER